MSVKVCPKAKKFRAAFSARRPSVFTIFNLVDFTSCCLLLFRKITIAFVTVQKIFLEHLLHEVLRDEILNLLARKNNQTGAELTAIIITAR